MSRRDQRRDAGDAERTPSDPRTALIESHLGLARHLVRLFEHRGESVDDLMQVASMGLVHAADRFDPDRGFEFSTFATETIVGELKRHFRDRAWAVKIPRSMQERYLEVSTAIDELTQSLGRPPSVQEVAAACRRGPDEVLAAMEAGQGYRASSLDARDADSFHHEVFDAVAALADRDELASHLAKLDERDREILRLRFVEERSQVDIADALGISQMHVSRLLRRALDALREAYGVPFAQ
jgi:RNA polymerase sigma-B factor